MAELRELPRRLRTGGEQPTLVFAVFLFVHVLAGLTCVARLNFRVGRSSLCPLSGGVAAADPDGNESCKAAFPRDR